MKKEPPAEASDPALDGVPQRGPAVRGLPPSVAETGEQPALFRREALEQKRTQWLGTVVLAPRRTHRIFTAAAATAALAILALLFFAGYTRTARVTGWLVPAEGLVRVFTPQPGIVTALYVKEGQQVHKGERLLTLSSEVQSSALGGTQTEIVRRIEERRRSLREQRDKHQQLVAHQEKTLAQRIDALTREHEQIGQEIALQRARAGLAAQNVARNRALRKQNFVSDAGLQQIEAAHLEQAGRVATLERDRTAKARERLALESELQELPFKAQAESAALEREIVAIEQELAATEARRELIVVAPYDGTVTAVLAEAGGQAGTGSPLLSIVPAGSALHAHLYSPSRAVGFVKPGQRVLLRYQAFPYQKFGHYEGVVTSVSRSPLSPAELPAQLSGLLDASGSKEPVYRVTVGLEKQAIRAYGSEIPLQPGTQLEADVALETRKLFEWVLDPLYTVSGKWRS